MPCILVPSSAKRIVTQISVIAKFKGRKDLVLKGCVCDWSFPAHNYLFKVSNWITRITCKNCSRLGTKTLEQSQCCCSGILIVICEHISHFVLIVYIHQANVFRVFIEKSTQTLLKTRRLSWFMLQDFRCEKNLLIIQNLLLCENKKFSDNIQHFNWIKLIDWYQLVYIDWLADIEWLDDLTC